MIDIALLRTDPELVRRTVQQRGTDVDVGRIAELDSQVSRLTARSNTLRTQQRRQALSGEQADAAQAPSEEIRAVTDELRAAQELRDELWAQVPNLHPTDTPVGVNGGVELRRAGEPVAADQTRHHDTVGARRDLVHRPPQPGGGFSWHGEGARLAWAVFTHAQSVLQACGFIPMITPVSTSGTTLHSYYGDQILDAATLPIRVCAFSPGLPTEVDGSHVYRIEQLVVCRPEDSEHWHAECQRIIEDFLRDLELPYRVMRACLGDLDAPEYTRCDTELWFPGGGEYRKAHSNSHLTDYLARRLRIRYLNRGRVAQPHTVSATAVTDRAVLAILENHLQPDGSVRIPAALRPYLGGQELI